jgi:hypothetical protein
MWPTGVEYSKDFRARTVWPLSRWLVERCDGLFYREGYGIADPRDGDIIWSTG